MYMKARVLQTYLSKANHAEDEVTIAIDNSEKEFEILGVTSSQGKKTLVVKLIETSDIQVGDSIESLVLGNGETGEVDNSRNVEIVLPTGVDTIPDLDIKAGSGEVTKTEE